MDASKSNPPQRNAAHRHHATQRDHGHLSRATTDVHHHVAHGLVNREPGSDGGSHGLFDQIAGGGSGPPGRLFDGTAFDRRDGGGNADKYLGPVQSADPHPVQEDAEHAFGHFEVGNGTAAQGALGHDVARGAPDHLPGVGANGQHFAGAGVECHHRWLIEHNALALGVHQCVGRPEINGQVARHSASWYDRTDPRPYFARVRR